MGRGNWIADDGWTFVKIITEKRKQLVQDEIKVGIIKSKIHSKEQIEKRAKLEKIMPRLMKKFETKTLKNGIFFIRKMG